MYTFPYYFSVLSRLYTDFIIDKPSFPRYSITRKGSESMRNTTVTVKVKYLGNEKIQWTRSDIDDVFYADNAFIMLAELIQISYTHSIVVKRVG